MNHDDEITELEAELRRMAMRRLPAEWKQLLLAPVTLPLPAAPWFPQPFVILLTGCWLAAAGFWLATPKDEYRRAPQIITEPPVETGNFLLGFNPSRELLE